MLSFVLRAVEVCVEEWFWVERVWLRDTVWLIASKRMSSFIKIWLFLISLWLWSSSSCSSLFKMTPLILHKPKSSNSNAIILPDVPRIPKLSMLTLLFNSCARLFSLCFLDSHFLSSRAARSRGTGALCTIVMETAVDGRKTRWRSCGCPGLL